MAVSKNLIKYVHSLEQKKYRQREQLFVAEGPKVVGDLMAHFQPRTLIATSDWLSANPSSSECFAATDEELRKVSFLQHPQQVVGLFPIPQSSDVRIDSTELSLALDGVQDPGNLGTIISLADWFGIKTIFCSQETADAYNPKVIQATMGSIARVNIVYTDLPSLIAELPKDFPVYGTLLDGENIYAQSLTTHGLIVMGNEGNGISPAVRPLVNSRLFIPSFQQGDTAESLNVAIATAITCSEFRRR